MTKPIIGIIGKAQPQYGEDIWHRIDEVDEIRYLIIKNGGTAIMLLPTEETLKFNDNDIKDNTILSDEELNELYRQIDLCDGFILQGGLYSSNYEIEMAKRIIELDKPLIGICAGFNNILRAIGTDVVEDKTKSHAWFTGFAPAEDPQICVTIIVENAGSGGSYAVPIAKRIFDAYFGVE